MKIIILFLTFGLCALSMTGCGSHYEKTATEKFSPSAEGKNKLVLENLYGTITVRKSSGDEVQITARKTANVRKKDLNKPFDEIKIDITESGDEIKVETIMNEIKRGLFAFESNQKVDYDIYVPDRFSVDISNVNGKIYVYDIMGKVDVENVNGDVTLINLPGKIDVDLVNGSIITDMPITKGFDGEVVNGKIYFNLGDSINAKVFADVTNGKIEADNINFLYSDNENDHLRGTMGQGDNEIRAQVVNGKIVFDRLGNSAGNINTHSSLEDIYNQKRIELEDAQRNLEDAQREYDKAEKNFYEKDMFPDEDREDTTKHRKSYKLNL